MNPDVLDSILSGTPIERTRLESERSRVNESRVAESAARRRLARGRTREKRSEMQESEGREEGWKIAATYICVYIRRRAGEGARDSRRGEFGEEREEEGRGGGGGVGGIAIKAICCIVPAIRRRQLSPTVLTSSQGLSAALEHVRFIDLSLFLPRRTSPTKTTLLRASEARAPRFRCVTPAANPGCGSCSRQLRLVDRAGFSPRRRRVEGGRSRGGIKFNLAFACRARSERRLNERRRWSFAT